MSHIQKHIFSFSFLLLFGILLFIFSLSVYVNEYLFFSKELYDFISIIFMFVGCSIIVFSSIFLIPKNIKKIKELNNGE